MEMWKGKIYKGEALGWKLKNFFKRLFLKNVKNLKNLKFNSSFIFWELRNENIKKIFVDISLNIYFILFFIYCMPFFPGNRETKNYREDPYTR